MEAEKERKEGVTITSQSEKLKRWPKKKITCCLSHYQIDYSSRIF
ncbi:MAG: hypothetical protein ACXAAM_02835 [Candidatus Heimdallarchaeaceae archaeon]|jgi:hypothetical protein